MKKIKLLLATCALLGGVLSSSAQMTDVTTTYITNPGFETDAAASNLTGAQNTPTGWTITPGSLSNTQWGTANSSTTIQGNSTSQTPSAGDNYFYFRCNWQSNTNISVKQNSKAELPAGSYVIYVDVFTYSSNATQPVYTFTVSDGSTTYVNGSITANKKAWATYFYHFKLDDAATLTFSANMTPKAAASGKHDWMLIDNIKLLKADYPVEPIANNTTDLYLYNEKEGQYISAGGASWGTHSTLDSYGYEMTATLSDGVYTLKTQQFNKYLGSDIYMDNGTGAKWFFLETEAASGKYYMTFDGVNYLTSNGANAELVNNVTTPTDASVWSIITKSERKAALSAATIDNPGNATFLIGDANFSRNCLTTPWTMVASNKNLSGGANGNMCAESYHSTFTLSQTLSSMPVGVYGLVAQGFYSQDGSDDEHLPYFYIADQKGTFPVKTGSENSMSAASASFSAGSYTIDPIYYRLDTEGDITLGAQLETNTDLWSIFDNFQLYYYGDVSVAAVKMKASVDAYNAAMEEAGAFTESSMFASDWSTLQTAISDNTLDLNDPALEESDLTTATANLVAANAAATAAVTGKTNYNTAVTTIDGGTNVDLTSLIVNPGFELGNTNGWTNSGTINTQAQGNNDYDNKQGSYYAERWHVSGTIDMNQTIAYLPAGVYKVEAYMYSDTEDAMLYVNSEEVSVSTSQKYHAVVTIADKGSIKIGGSCTLTGSTWFCMDDFKLTYLATSIATLPYTLATGKMGTDKSSAQEDAETTFTSEPTMDNYNALLDAISDAEISVANFAKLKAAIDEANAIKAANNFVTEDATTAFQDEIDDATDAWTDVTYTDAEATAEIAALGSAVSGHHGNASGKAGNYIVSAWDTNTDGETHNWDGYVINTWSEEGDNDGSNFSVPFLEYWVSSTNNLPAKTMTATLTEMPNGWYEIEIWARVQRRSDADFNANNSMITMSVNGGDAVSIMSNTSNNVGSGNSVMRLGRYTARGKVTDGTLTLAIDVKLGSNVHWLSWRDITYTKIDDESVTVSSAGYATYASDNALDFTGSDIKAYIATTKGDGTGVNFAQINKVPANTGVLLYKEDGATDYIPVFDGTGADEVEGNVFVRGTGTAVATDDGTNYNYILNNKGGNLGFYRAAGQTVATNRAYISILKSESAGVKEFISLPGTEDEADGIASPLGETGEGVSIYNVAGQRISKLQKGINIVNGKKVLK